MSDEDRISLREENAEEEDSEETAPEEESPEDVVIETEEPAKESLVEVMVGVMEEGLADDTEFRSSGGEYKKRKSRLTR